MQNLLVLLCWRNSRKVSQLYASMWIILCLVVGGNSARALSIDVQEGDIIFQTSRSAQSVAIQQATGSRLSHMGIILFKQGQPYVFEAVQPVKYTPLKQWIARGQNGYYELKRLKNAQSVLTPQAIAALHQEAKFFHGKSYDSVFAWSDERIYCSELVWKLFDRALHIQIGQLQKLGEFNLSSPQVRTKLNERYGASIPLLETVISPVAIAKSPLLVFVGQSTR